MQNLNFCKHFIYNLVNSKIVSYINNFYYGNLFSFSGNGVVAVVEENSFPNSKWL